MDETPPTDRTTTQEQCRRALLQSDEGDGRYLRIFESMIEGLGLAEILLDEQGRPWDFRLLEANEAFGRLIGVPASQVRGRTARELMPRLEPPWIDTFGKVALTGEPAWFQEYSAGLDKWFEVCIHRTEPGRFAFLMVDITALKRAEEAAVERCKLADTVFTHTISALMVLDRSGKVLRVNDAYVRASRRELSDLAGRNIFEIYPSDAKRIFDEVLHTKRPFTTSARRFVFPDQPERGVTYWDWTLFPVFDHAGEVEHLVFSFVEVTERKRAEDALRESEARYRQQAAELELIYHTAPIGLCVLDTGLRYVHINEHLAELNGLPVEAHLGKTVRELLPQVADRIEPMLRRVLATGEPVLEFEASGETPAQPGVQRTWISEYWPLKNEAGEIFGINVVAVDVTERRRLEEIRRREQEFRSLAENSADVVVRFDRALRRIYVNPAIETILGRSRDEILGKTNLELGLPREIAESLDRRLEEVFSSGQPQTMEVVMPTPHGERCLESRLVPELGPDGCVETLLAISRDITERKRAEAALQESEIKHRTLVENLYEGILLIDAEGTTTFVNVRMAELLGYRVDEMLGKPVYDFLGEQAASTARESLARGPGLRAEYEVEFRRKDGTSLLTHAATTSLFDQSGAYRGVLAAVVDMTARARTEAALQAYAEGQDFLVATALRLLQPMDRSELFEFVTERIHRLAGDAIVLFNEFDPVNRRTLLRAVGCTGEERALISRLLGRDPIGITLDFPESLRERMLPGELDHLAGGVCELAFYQLPQALCEALERELRIRKVYAMACSVEQDLLGTVAVLNRGKSLPHKRLIETVVTEAALALKRRRVEDALQKERNFFDTVLDTQGAVVAILDPRYCVIRLNRAYGETTGFTLDSKIGRAFSDLMESASVGAVEHHLDELALRGGAGEFESRVRVREGYARHVSWRTTVLRKTTGEIEYVIATGIDITARKQMEERTRHLAEHDALTDLPNRRLLLELLEAALQGAKRSERKVALLFLDLDRFKIINDTLGHDAGDTLLKEVAHRLSGRVRRSDIVARLGGDEFAVLLGELSHGEQAGEVAREILRNFHLPFHLDDQSLHVTASLGISLFPDDSDVPEGLLRRADLAMYEAKEQGRNTYRFYNPVVDRRARERARIETSLRHALERDELRVVYQPEIDLRTGRPVCVEALVRWHHPELGILDPARFIPVAEETELIGMLDDWVLRHACLQGQRWIAQAVPPICIAVNVSAKRFESPDLVEAVRHHLAESGLDPKNLELELTEHTVMHRIEQSIDRMRELVALGVSIAVDDFGTGYSSLSYLKQLPIGKLKIDQSFVRDIASDADDRAIIQAVTALAHTLNKRVIAEGVETEAQRTFLAGTGCDEAQGYFFTRPIPPEAIAQLLTR